MKNEITLTKETIESIEEKLNLELLKRGFPNVKVEQHCENRLIAESEEFQTTPVIFKSIRVEDFDGGFTVEEDLIHIWIRLHARYEKFSGGTNGTNIIEFRAVTTLEQDGSIGEEQVW